MKKAPSPLISLLPIVVLVILLFATIRVFGSDALNGGSQISLLTTTAICILIGMAFYKIPWKDYELAITNNVAGANPYGTKRNESDTAQILSGVFEGRTTGTPITIIVYNADHHSADYSNIAERYRPGHADFGFDAKYGFRDYRGGGRSSGRETLCSAIRRRPF